MNTTPWKKIKEELIVVGYRKIMKKTFLMPDKKERIFDVLYGHDVVSILALTPDHNVILARQFRPGPEKIYDDLPGGFIEEKEDILVAAKRELLEETGYSGDLTYVGSCPAGSYSTMKRHTVIAQNCYKVKEQQLDEGEYITVVLKSFDEFLQQLHKGEMTTTVESYMAVEYLKSAKNI